MRKQETNTEQFLQDLGYYLRRISPQERAEILRDQEELIRDAIESGRSEEEVLASLGTARQMARNLILELKLSEAEQTTGVSSQLKMIFGIVIAFLALAPLNLIFVLGPFLLLVTLIFSGWISVATFLAVVIAAIVMFFWQMIFASVGLLTHLATFFLFLGGLGLGVLSLMIMAFLTAWFFKGMTAYLRWNLNFIRARA
jgi:uncharacterized membrane protein